MISAPELPDVVKNITSAAQEFLSALTSDQRQTVGFSFADGDERRDWTFVPKPARNGLPLAALDSEQRKLAHALLSASTSMDGYAKAVSVIAMEHVLYAKTASSSREFADALRDPSRYYVSVFGEPGDASPWGWRMVGHHLSLNFTVVDSRYLTATPSLFGAEPSQAGELQPLALEESAGYELIHALDPAQRQQAVIWHRSPPDFATRTVPEIGSIERPDELWPPEPGYRLSDDERQILSYHRDQPKGIPASEFGEAQRRRLTDLLTTFARRFPAGLASAELEAIRTAGLDRLWFAWAGGTEPGQRHYFRVQGPGLLIEHDNTQDNAKHIHSVWRNPDNDFAGRMLERG